MTTVSTVTWSHARPSLFIYYPALPFFLLPSSFLSFTPPLPFRSGSIRSNDRENWGENTRRVEMEGFQISLPLALLAALLLLASASATAESSFLHRLDHRHRSPVPAVSNVCKRAEFPRLCESFVPKLHTVTAESVIEATVQAAISGAKDAKALADEQMDSSTTDNDVKGGLDVCRQNFDMLLLDLQKGLENLKGTGSHNDLMSNLSAALADIDSCDDSFNEAPGMKSPVSHLTSYLRKLALNSLSLADDLN